MRFALCQPAFPCLYDCLLYACSSLYVCVSTFVFTCLHPSLSVFTILYLCLYLCPYLCLYLSLPALPAFYTLYLRSPDLPLHTYTGLYPPLPAFTCLYLALTVCTFTAGARARVL